jgi:hypothetical protein
MRDLRGFKYSLESLQKKCDWDLRELTLRLAHINENFATQREQVDAIDGELTCMNAEMLKALGRNMVIDIGRLCIASGYQMHLHQRLNSAETNLAQIERERDNTMKETYRLKKYTDGLDEHRDDAMNEYSKELDKAAIVEADDSWLRSSQRRIAI